ncbi:MAG: hypothetical protein LBS30_03910 [Planctomycetota bacterium]|jgi:hypothetical protein|nr:hypothetical protein [Planctomycetota bacterium]
MSIELREEARRREAEQEALRKNREQFALDVRAVASRPEGRRLLGRLLARGGIFRSDCWPGAAGAYQAGRKASALELWRTLRECLPRDQFVAIALEEEEHEATPDNSPVL